SQSEQPSTRIPIRGRLPVDRPFSLCPDRGSAWLGTAIHTGGHDETPARRARAASPGARASFSWARTNLSSAQEGCRATRFVGLHLEPGLGACCDICGLGACARTRDLEHLRARACQGSVSASFTIHGKNDPVVDET